ncbi:glycosyltransferase [Microseira sp. BLCC-F43]|uniref:glycosyltransferase n=1 Tax=Microseira sp. BLCC-F43 TaxID=3153602 RepID=UPI0035BC7AF0
MSNKIGVVVIGRNEGSRLVRSLNSVVGESRPVVYVDSGSTDSSCAFARSIGVEVVELDMSIPFTAARARNAGFERLRQLHPTVEYVQFIDGDCEVIEGWLIAGAETLEAKPDVVAVCGWTCERHPERNIYTRICNIEWHMGPVGEISNFGGNVMIRADALAAVGGFNPSVIAAEDDELGVRLRQAGGKLLRLDRDSVLHEVDMDRLWQWWQRAKRCGYAFAQVSQLHGAPPERKFVKDIRQTWLWGFIMPLVALILMLPTGGLSLIIFARYPLTALKVAYKTKKRGFSWADGFAWGVSCAMSAFPQVLGVVQYLRVSLITKQHQIIEYKAPQAPATKPTASVS